MGKLIGVIIGLVIYFGGGWIIKDIIYSMFGDDLLSMSFEELYLWDLYIYLVITAIFCLIYIIKINVSTESSISAAVITALVAMAFLIYGLPMSMGMVVLFNIVNILSIILAVCVED